MSRRKIENVKIRTELIRELNVFELVTYMRIVEECKSRRECWLSLTQLSTDTGIGTTTLKISLKSLLDMNLIKIKNDARRKTKTYILTGKEEWALRRGTAVKISSDCAIIKK